MERDNKNRERLPLWMKGKMPSGERYSRVRNLIRKQGLHTICVSGNCPNNAECWNAGTATFMILGDVCTRNCRFCGVPSGKPAPPDAGEPLRLARSVRTLVLKHCVLTSVDRDDLADGGAAFWARTIALIREHSPGITIEALIPDFNGKKDALDKIIGVAPELVSHNLETVRRLSPVVRSRASYDTSLGVLQYLRLNKMRTKSGIMLGLGEKRKEVLETMDDLLRAGCRIFTLGQYLSPGPDRYPVREYIPPEGFDEYRMIGLEKGFEIVESGPLVRSSYHAEKHL